MCGPSCSLDRVPDVPPVQLLPWLAGRPDVSAVPSRVWPEASDRQLEPALWLRDPRSSAAVGIRKELEGEYGRDSCGSKAVTVWWALPTSAGPPARSRVTVEGE